MTSELLTAKVHTQFLEKEGGKPQCETQCCYTPDMVGIGDTSDAMC